MKSRLWAIALVAVLASLSPAAAQNASGASGSPRHESSLAETFIADNIAKGLAILNDPALSEQQRSQQFESLLLSLTDTRRIAIFTLGQYAAKASSADQAAFADAFQKYSVAVYRSYFSRFSGQSLIVTGSQQRAPADFIVLTTLNDPKARSGQQPMVVDFRVRTDAGKPEVTDLNVLGVWLALSQRDQFVSYLNAHGGSVPNLTAYVLQVATQLAHPPGH